MQHPLALGVSARVGSSPSYACVPGGWVGAPSSTSSPTCAVFSVFWPPQASVHLASIPQSTRHDCTVSSSSHARCLGRPCRRCCSRLIVTPPSVCVTTPCSCSSLPTGYG